MTLYDLNSYYKDGWEICGDHFGDEYRKLNSIKKQMTLLLLSKGATMLSVGDLIAHSKRGNANSYQEENEINYLDYSTLQKMMKFWKFTIIFKKC